MSAWLVSKAHIDCLVQAMAVEGVIAFDQATTTGRLLWNENCLSLGARYDDPIPPEIGDYVFKGVGAPLDDAIVRNQIGCYGYQSCEHEEWEASEAKALCDRLQALLDGRLGEEADDTALPWGIDRIEEAFRR
jgi:hypothetical protein